MKPRGNQPTAKTIDVVRCAYELPVSAGAGGVGVHAGAWYPAGGPLGGAVGQAGGADGSNGGEAGCCGSLAVSMKTPALPVPVRLTAKPSTPTANTQKTAIGINASDSLVKIPWLISQTHTK